MGLCYYSILRHLPASFARTISERCETKAASIFLSRPSQISTFIMAARKSIGCVEPRCARAHYKADSHSHARWPPRRAIFNGLINTQNEPIYYHSGGLDAREERGSLLNDSESQGESRFKDPVI